MWYETGEFPRFMRCSGSGTFTLHGAMVATAMREGEAAMEFDDFKGRLTFLTSIFHSGSRSVPIVVKGRGKDTRLMILGSEMGVGEDYFTDSSDAGRIALLESFQYTPGGGGKSIADRGEPNPRFIREMLSQTRGERPERETHVPSTATHFELHRVCVYNTQAGIRLVH
jgi:hypothetical protein